MSYKHIIFDVDGTLLDSEKATITALQETIRELKNKEVPYEDMKFTKESFGKTDGILAFHGYQSFKKGEVTAAVAHEIGVKFAEEMFKDYEVVVSTHQNTNHIHNHFILNSVSFKTGKKYNNNRTNIAKLRQISDSLCAEYGLSVLDEDKVIKAPIIIKF